MKPTTLSDLDYRINSQSNFQAQINDEWRTIYAPSFFEFLSAKGRITGHMPEHELLWIETYDAVWNWSLQDVEDVISHEEMSYQDYLHDEVQDEDVIEYLESNNSLF